MENEEVAKAFHQGEKPENALNLTGLTTIQVADSKAVYGHLRALIENQKKLQRLLNFV